METIYNGVHTKNSKQKTQNLISSTGKLVILILKIKCIYNNNNIRKSNRD